MDDISTREMIEQAHEMPEDVKLLYLSAMEVQRSTFWKWLMSALDKEIYLSMGSACTKLMQGKDAAALVEAAKVQGFGWLLQTIDSLLEDLKVAAQNQGQEVEDNE